MRCVGVWYFGVHPTGCLQPCYALRWETCWCINFSCTYGSSTEYSVASVLWSIARAPKCFIYIPHYVLLLQHSALCSTEERCVSCMRDANSAFSFGTWDSTLYIIYIYAGQDAVLWVHLQWPFNCYHNKMSFMRDKRSMQSIEVVFRDFLSISGMHGHQLEQTPCLCSSQAECHYIYRSRNLRATRYSACNQRLPQSGAWHNHVLKCELQLQWTGLCSAQDRSRKNSNILYYYVLLPLQQQCKKWAQSFFFFNTTVCFIICIPLSSMSEHIVAFL